MESIQISAGCFAYVDLLGEKWDIKPRTGAFDMAATTIAKICLDPTLDFSNLPWSTPGANILAPASILQGAADAMQPPQTIREVASMVDLRID